MRAVTRTCGSPVFSFAHALAERVARDVQHAQLRQLGFQQQPCVGDCVAAELEHAKLRGQRRCEQRGQALVVERRLAQVELAQRRQLGIFEQAGDVAVRRQIERRQRREPRRSRERAQRHRRELRAPEAQRAQPGERHRRECERTVVAEPARAEVEHFEPRDVAERRFGAAQTEHVAVEVELAPRARAECGDVARRDVARPQREPVDAGEARLLDERAQVRRARVPAAQQQPGQLRQQRRCDRPRRAAIPEADRGFAHERADQRRVLHQMLDRLAAHVRLEGSTRSTNPR